MWLENILMDDLYEDEQVEQDLVRSRSWSKDEWEIYLSSIESKTPEEEIYVGTSNDLEQYVAKKKYKNQLFF